MNGNPICWFEIYVQDMDRARAFYEQVFAVKLTAIDDPGGELSMLGFPQSFEQHGASGALVKADGVGSGGDGSLLYFACEDCAVEASRIAAAGGEIEQEKMSLGEFGFMVMARDTEGNRIGLHSMA